MKLCKTVLLMLIFANPLFADSPVDGTKVGFKKHTLDSDFRSEGVTAADFNNDGKTDIAAGFVWYEAPDWKLHKITADAKTYEPKNYSNSFVTFSQDMNSDGWMDVIVVDFPGTPTWWFENPKNQDGSWARHTVTPVSNNESPQFLDLTGDGKREFVMAVNSDAKKPDGPERQMAFLRQPSSPTELWQIQTVSVKGAPATTKYSHGLGIGDVNKDGRNDILVKDGWWEAADGFANGEWKFHAESFGEDCSHMYVYDFDGDGDHDVLSASAHKFGIWCCLLYTSPSPRD